MRRHELLTDHPPHHPAAGAAHGFPTLASTLIAMVKDTSLAANITVTEMFMTTQRIVARTYEPLALYIEVGLVYLLFCTVLTRLQAVGERYLNSKGAQRS